MNNNEDIMHITPDLINKLDADIEEGTNYPIIIVRLVSRQKRNEIYANRFKAKDIEGFPLENMEKIFINENFTQKR